MRGEEKQKRKRSEERMRNRAYIRKKNICPKNKLQETKKKQTGER